MKSLFSSLLGWVIIPAVVIYGYYFGNEACMSITIFYMWIVFILMFFTTIALGLALLADTEALGLALLADTDLDTSIKDKKKLKAVLKWNDKLKSKWFNFTSSASSILYLGLAILIASIGNIWTAFMFTITFVLLKYVLLTIIKELHKKIVSKVKAIIEEEHTKDNYGEGIDD